MTNRYVATTLLVAAALLLVGWVVALQDPVPGWELRLTEDVNEAPGRVADGLWPVMQLGTVGGAAVVALGALVWKRSWALASAVLLSGAVAWFAAKGVKRLVERGRPLQYLPEIVVREGSGTGLGFVSGHTAVAFACAAALAPSLPRAGRVVAYAAAGVVGVARIVHGVHLPADVVGGAGLGLACGTAVRWALDRWV